MTMTTTRMTTRTATGRRTLRAVFAAAMMNVFVTAGWAIDLEEGQRILAEIDSLRTFTESDFASVVTMVSEDPEEGVSRQVVRQFRRDSEDTFLMLIESPATMLGQGYLRVEDNLWFYDPESRNFSHSSMKERFSGSDARNSDFGASSYREDYRVVAVEEGRLGSYDVYILDLEATSNEVTYAAQRLWVTRDPYLPLKIEDYSEAGRLMRTSLFPSYTRAGETYVATTMIFVDELVDGRKTRIDVTDVSAAPLPDTIFTKAYVERVNR
jgi:outer membrane lipoprotein-sorting protein